MWGLDASSISLKPFSMKPLGKLPLPRVAKVSWAPPSLRYDLPKFCSLLITCFEAKKKKKAVSRVLLWNMVSYEIGDVPGVTTFSLQQYIVPQINRSSDTHSNLLYGAQ